jgi:hypothetical protein
MNFSKKLLKILTVSFASSLVIFSQVSNADETPVKVKKTTVVVKESEGTEAEATPSPTPAIQEVEKTKTATFGSKSQAGLNGCKTEEALQDVIKDLKADCKAWVKDQKSELKSRFLTSSCEESCEDCGMSLRRCSITGSVTYILRTTTPPPQQ